MKGSLRGGVHDGQPSFLFQPTKTDRSGGPNGWPRQPRWRRAKKRLSATISLSDVIYADKRSPPRTADNYGTRSRCERQICLPLFREESRRRREDCLVGSAGKEGCRRLSPGKKGRAKFDRAIKRRSESRMGNHHWSGWPDSTGLSGQRKTPALSGQLGSATAQRPGGRRAVLSQENNPLIGVCSIRPATRCVRSVDGK